MRFRRRRHRRIDYAQYQPGQWPLLGLVLRSEWDDVVELAGSCGVADGERPDVALHVFFRYALFRASIASPRAIRSWLRTTTIHVAYHFRKGTIARHEIPHDPVEIENDEGLSGPEREDDVPSAEEDLSARRAERVLLGLVDDLEPDRREVFRRYALQDQPIAAIAAELGIPEATAYNRLRLAREDLQAALRRAEKIEQRRTGKTRLGLFPLLLLLRFEPIERLHQAWKRAWSRERAWPRERARPRERAFPQLLRGLFRASLATGILVAVAAIPGGTAAPVAAHPASSSREITARAAPSSPRAPDPAPRQAMETATLVAPAALVPVEPTDALDPAAPVAETRQAISATLRARAAGDRPPATDTFQPPSREPSVGARSPTLAADRIATVAARAALENGSLREAWTRLRDLDTLFPQSPLPGAASDPQKKAAEADAAGGP